MTSRTSPSAARKADLLRLLRRTQLTASHGAVSCRHSVPAYANFSISALREQTTSPYGAIRGALFRTVGTPRTRGRVRCPAAPTAHTT
ncbi:hypothetical protein M2159_008736 [Streptomyces sp. SAI-090]|nr:hypothetical protein [Streptomyces sp. SAI-090]